MINFQQIDVNVKTKLVKRLQKILIGNFKVQNPLPDILFMLRK